MFGNNQQQPSQPQQPQQPPQPPPSPQQQQSGPGPLPAAAAQRVERLAALEREDASAFTSDLSVNEFVLIHRLGYQPLGYVMGTSIYHVGFQQQRWRQSFEMTVLTEAMSTARHLAIERMRTEAHALGADGVVGVRLRILTHAWQEGELEFIAEGTAVRHRESDGRLRLRDGGPFTSDLSGQDFYTLVTHGHMPRSFVFGVCVYHVAAQSMRQSWNMVGRNMEIPLFTEAVYTARELAMSRMESEANRFGADGIVGVSTQVFSHVWGAHASEFLAVGTSVTTSPTIGEDEPPTMTLSLG